MNSMQSTKEAEQYINQLLSEKFKGVRYDNKSKKQLKHEICECLKSAIPSVDYKDMLDVSVIENGHIEIIDTSGVLKDILIERVNNARL